MGKNVAFKVTFYKPSKERKHWTWTEINMTYVKYKQFLKMLKFNSKAKWLWFLEHYIYISAKKYFFIGLYKV